MFGRETVPVIDLLARRPARPLLAGIVTALCLLGVTLAGYALGHWISGSVAAVSWLYLLAVVPVTLRWGRYAGVATVAVAGVLLAWFVAAPYDSPRISDPHEITRLAISLGGMVLVVFLVDWINQERAERERLYEREREARDEAEAARQRFTFLAGASAALATSLDTETTLHSLTRLMVPTIGDYCIIDTVGEDEQISRAAVAIADPNLADVAAELRAYALDPGDDRSVALRVLRSGEAELQEDLRADPDAIVTRDERHAEILRMLEPTSRIVVPLTAHGRILGVLQVGVSHDRLRYAPADLSLVKGLASRAALALDNARLYREAQEALQTRDEFLGSVSHDLKTPLTAIKGMTQLARRRLARISDAEAAKAVEMLSAAEAAAAKMETMLRDLLDITRLQTGRPLDLRLAPVDLVALVGAVAEELQRTTSAHIITLKTALQELAGVWDSGRLDRVLSNLLSNAIKYSDGGTITVTICTEAGDGDDQAVLSVRDEGVGIPAADLPHVFERFHRGANIREKASGSGIGLAGARSIVAQHGGTITAESTEGVGSVFTVRLPLQPEGRPELLGEARP